MKNLELKITSDHYHAVKEIISRNKLKPDVIGFHGQTILHEPEKSVSIQLGNGNLLSKLLKIDVVYDFRKNDLVQKGQGAPISPIYHKFLIMKKNLEIPACFINIGGISNISYWNGKQLIGYDIGPGNCLIDKTVQESIRKKYDKNGEIASKGTVDREKLKTLLDDDYFNLKFPKSLDKNYFNKYLDMFSSSNLKIALLRCLLLQFHQ